MKKCQATPTGALFAQMAENWNEQVTKLFNWSINRLQAAADKSNVKATQTDFQLPSVKEGRRARKLHQREGAKGFPSYSSETDLTVQGIAERGHYERKFQKADLGRSVEEL
jgi:hypothetical protein